MISPVVRIISVLMAMPFSLLSRERLAEENLTVENIHA